MCIVIDENTIAMYFNVENQNHPTYSPLEEWREKRKKVIVFGGTDYLKELSRSPRHLSHLRQLEKTYQAIEINRVKVDKRKREIDEILGNKTACNDQHIIALLDSCKAKILCSNDNRSFVYIRDVSLYNYNRPPFIYKHPNHIKQLKKRKDLECNGPCC